MTRRALLLLLLLLVAGPAAAGPRETFVQAWRVVRDQFYDPRLHGLDWPAVRQEMEPRARVACSEEALAGVVNEMLDRLGASHTRYYSPGTPEYYQLLGIFRMNLPSGKPPKYRGLPITVQELPEGPFVRAVHEAGLAVLPGDRVAAVDGRPWDPRSPYRGTRARLQVQRVRGGPLLAVDLPVRELNPREFFLEDMKATARVIPVGTRKAAYVRVWCYAGGEVQEALLDLLASEPLHGADGLVLDLRGGWGGASPDALNMLNRKVPVLDMVDRDGRRTTWDRQWRKPLAMLVDGGTRSGKEILADGMQRYGLGPVVGTRTAGAVLGGRPFLLDNGGLLYLAVADVTVDGRRLEGVGVEPDVPVDLALPYSAGQDPQLERALEVLFRP